MEKIRKELEALSRYEVVLFGSCVTGDATLRSDIDIAVLTRDRDEKKNSKIWFYLLGKNPPVYDLKIFELLPLHIKAEVMDNYIVIFGDSLEISEYFYYYRKLWKDVKFRYEENRITTHAERLKGLENFKKIQSLKKSRK